MPPVTEPPTASRFDRTGWSRLPIEAPLADSVLTEILDGGQSFRWWRQPVGSWLGTFGRSVVELRRDEAGSVWWQSRAGAGTATAKAVATYFDVARDPAALADVLPWRSDAHLARCVSAFPGLRILRQPFGETLLGFLCSATKQIVQIKQMLALLAVRHGQPLGGPPGPAIPGESPVSCASSWSTASGQSAEAAPPRRDRPGATPVEGAWFALPTWPELARLSEAQLRACQLGFRARYIHQTAQFLAAHPGWLDETEHLPYSDAKERLCSLPGVGEKVADCVLLFGAGRLEAFPVDVWIIRTLAERYRLDGWRPAQLAQFGRVHFGRLAGLAQQFLFAYERAAARSRPPAPARRAVARRTDVVT